MQVAAAEAKRAERHHNENLQHQLAHDRPCCSSTDQGGGKRREDIAANSLGSVHAPKSESVCNGLSNGPFAGQNGIDGCALDTMAPRKSGLASLKFNHGSQQADNGIYIKHDRWSAETLGLTL